MAGMFESLWHAAPQLMSVIGILAILFFIALKVSQLYLQVENMDKRLTRLEEKVDMIIEYLFQDRFDRGRPRRYRHKGQ